MPPEAQPLPVFLIPLHLLQDAPWNVTKPNKRSVNLLAQNIREIGFAETALVVPLGPWEHERSRDGIARVTSGDFRIISGHDKRNAAAAAGMTEMPCSVSVGMSEDLQKLVTVRMNVIKKKMDPQKFMAVYSEVAEQYSEEVAEAMMMFTDEAALKRLISEARQALPTQEMKAELDAKSEKVKTVDDLASVIEELHSRTGSTSLDKGFTILSYGSQEHIYIAMDKPLHAAVQRLMDRATTENRHIAEIFKEALGVA